MYPQLIRIWGDKNFFRSRIHYFVPPIMELVVPPLTESEVLGQGRVLVEIRGQEIEMRTFELATKRKILKDCEYPKEEVPNDRSSYKETLQTKILVANSRRKSIWHDVTPHFWTFFAPSPCFAARGHGWLKLRGLRAESADPTPSKVGPKLPTANPSMMKVGQLEVGQQTSDRQTVAIHWQTDRLPRQLTNRVR